MIVSASVTLIPASRRIIAFAAATVTLTLLPYGGSRPSHAADSSTKGVPAKAAPTRAESFATTPLTAHQKAVHALNRLAFGPRPGDVERIQSLGIQGWLAQQLEPRSIDDALVDAKLSRLTTLNLTSSQLMMAHLSDQLMMKLRNMERQKNQRERAARAAAANGTMANDAMQRPAMRGFGAARMGRNQEQPIPMEIVAQLNPRDRQLYDMARQAGFSQGIAVQVVGELLTAKIVRATESNRQLQEVLVDFWSNHFNLDVKKQAVRTLKTVDERDVIRPHVLGRFRDLLGASAKSPAMLIYLDNARSTKEFAPPPRRMARRQARNRLAPINNPNAPLAMPQSMPAPEAPEAMAAPGAMPAMEAEVAPAPAPRPRGGLNENYARELMELHTLGVNGGYTQKDVQEVARCLTGWTINRELGTFLFRPGQHDNGAKVVLGHTIPAGGGMRDGEMVLDILASHPSTARRIARKLCVRLVGDEPPSALVERAAKAFVNSDGDLKAVTRTIVTAPEFFSPAAYRAKIKSPFEYAVSAVRALGGTLEVPDPADFRGRAQLLADGGTSVREGGQGRVRLTSMARQIATMGQPLFSYQAPTGYPENSQQWVSVGALVARLNFALALTGGTVTNVNVRPSLVLEGVRADDHEAVLGRIADQLIGDDLSAATRATLKEQITPQTPADAAKLTALVLGSPEFQRR